jgi:hypothetical protein
MTDLPIGGKLVPLFQGQFVADAANVQETGTDGNVQTALTTLRTNVATNTRAIQDGGNNAPDVTSLTSKVDALYPLTPYVPDLGDFGSIYSRAVASQQVTETDGYSDFIDYRSSSERFESSTITHTPGGGVIDYTNVAGDFHRCFGFQVTGPSNQVLLWVIDGGAAIPLIDMTAAGNLRINDYTPSRTQDEVVTDHPNIVRSATSGPDTLTVGGGAITYTIPDYPANTSSQSRTLSIDLDVFENGVDTRAGGFIFPELPDTVAALATQEITHNFFLGFPSNRTVTATFNVEARVSGVDLVVDITLTAAPAGFSFSVDSFVVEESYTASVVIARVDDFQTVTDESGDFVFTAAEEFLLAFHPIPNTTRMRVVPVAANIASGVVAQLNTVIIPEPTPGFASIRIPDTIEFRSFLPDHFLNHPDLATLVRNRAVQWVYGLARLETIAVRSITQPINLDAGTTLGGATIILPSTSVVHQATGKGTGAGELITNLTLPANYTSFEYLHVTIYVAGTPPEWRSAFIDIELLENGDVGASELIRIQGASDFSWTSGTRVLTNQGGQEIYRAVLISLG